VGLVREALRQIEPEEMYLQYERRQFWKAELFDAGMPTAFVDIASLYHFNWTEIIPDMYVGKFGDRFEENKSAVPPVIAETWLKRLLVFALEKTNGEAIYDQILHSLKDSQEAMLNTPASPELSALPNNDALLKDLAGHLKKNELVAVLFIDLDNFKQVNDQLGHAEGTNCLTQVVNEIGAMVARKGKLYRAGGDEFCVMLLNFSVPEATATAERIRSKIDGLTPFGGVVKVTASIGVAASDTPDAATAEALVDAADKAMYVAKHTTKNRVCSWPTDPAQAAAAEANRKKATAPPKAPAHSSLDATTEFKQRLRGVFRHAELQWFLLDRDTWATDQTLCKQVDEFRAALTELYRLCPPGFNSQPLHDAIEKLHATKAHRLGNRIGSRQDVDRVCEQMRAALAEVGGILETDAQQNTNHHPVIT
jgi:diguanylate cyclase (GGDEF)-like protein